MRSWQLLAENEPKTVTTADLAQYRACSFLGAAGLGKTVELEYLAEIERAGGLDVRSTRLAELATSADRLDSCLKALVSNLTDRTVIYLDALDEAMVSVQTSGLALATWIRTLRGTPRPVLRITCRSAVWPETVSSAIHEVYGADAATAILQPLSDDEIRAIVESKGIQSASFANELARVGVTVLARQPLTLDMLMREYLAEGRLPQGRAELFEQGVVRLARERMERREIGTASSISLEQILDAAERLACFTLLSGREMIDLGDAPPTSSLGSEELSRLPGAGRPLDDELLRGLGNSGLCEGAGLHCFRFAHRQFGEYLAGRRLARLLPNQAKALLASALGWRSGVAGNLRETAAFAAMANSDLAKWVAECDPELVGLSDVAEDTLRRQALLRMFDRFRRHELTDAQASRDRTQLAGFRYPNVENDLRPILGERGAASEDVLEFALELVQDWGLASMSDVLADLALDPKAPLQARVAASYALVQLGGASAKHRLKPLITDPKEDSALKGLALRCNWPDNLTVPELLDALTSDYSTSHFGAYEGFIRELDEAGFDAGGFVKEGLVWARRFHRRGSENDAAVRLVRRVAQRALVELAVPGVPDLLADLLLDAGDSHSGSPLNPISHVESGTEGTREEPPFLKEHAASRHALIDALVARKSATHFSWWVLADTPGLLVVEDFAWLIDRALDSVRPMAHRQGYVEMARVLPWYNHSACVELWLNARETEPIASMIKVPLFVALDSEVASTAREAHARGKRANRVEQRTKVQPAPTERVQHALGLCETKSPQYFANLCREMTLEECSVHYTFERFLVRTPGWMASDPATKARIVGAAKRLLTARTNEPKRSRSVPLSSVLMGYMHAVWLLLEVEPDWIEELPLRWWRRWAWYLLRELHPRMMGEPEEPKLTLVSRLYCRAPSAVRAVILELARDMKADSSHLLESLLEILQDIPDAQLDRAISKLISAGVVSSDRVRCLAEFVLSRDTRRAIPACLGRLSSLATGSAEETAVQAAVALLTHHAVQSLEAVSGFLHDRSDLAQRVLSQYAIAERQFYRRNDATGSAAAALPPNEAGRLAAMFLKHFPCEQDPRHDGAYCVTPDDAARDFRDRLIGWLGEQKSGEAVIALRDLESRFGQRYPWLRRPRAKAEQAFRSSHWRSIPLHSVAELLAANTNAKRLIRSELDAVEGIIEALESYGRSLRHDSPSDLEDLWDLPRRAAPSPKSEERVSDKLCQVIRTYFRDHAVTADREVQVSRRRLPSAAGGTPGSELDVLVRIPAAGSVDGDAIAIPVEVKLSNNPEARTGLQPQLVDRYMHELGTSHGVFVVAWLYAPGMKRCHRPKWVNVNAADRFLRKQASEVADASSGLLIVHPVIIDASLSTVPPKRPRSRRTQMGGDKGVIGKSITSRRAKTGKKAGILSTKRLKQLTKSKKAERTPKASAAEASPKPRSFTKAKAPPRIKKRRS